MNWTLITHLGDAALVLPLIVAAAAGLALQGAPQRRAALRWCGLVAASLALVAASKIAFYGWGTGVRHWNLTCFSGHAVSAWLVWPAVLMLLAPTRCRRLRLVLLVLGIALAAVVGWSRVPLGAHPISEVLAGTALGALVAWRANRALRSCAFDARAAGLLLAVPLLLGLASQAGLDRPRTEDWFQRIGIALSGAGAPGHPAVWPAATP